MKIEHPNAKEPTPKEVAQLAKLEVMIERAIEDGRLTHDEYQAIQAEIMLHGAHAPEQFYRQLQLFRRLVTDKLDLGQLEVDSPGF